MSVRVAARSVAIFLSACPLLFESAATALGKYRVDSAAAAMSAAEAEPFRRAAVPVTEGEVPSKWSGVIADIGAESDILTRCRETAAFCDPAKFNENIVPAGLNYKFALTLAEAASRSHRSPLMSKHRAIAAGLVSLALLAAARLTDAQPAQQHSDEDCGEIARGYDLIKADAVSVQTNIALFKAADRGCDALTKQLLAAGASLQARDRRGAMPLAHAAREGHVRLVEFFLASGAPINARNVDGATALFAAAEGEKHSTVTLLLNKGADPNLPGRRGVTALMAAAFKGNERIFATLLAHGANPAVQDEIGKSAMVYAAARGFDGIVARLLDAGIDARQRYGNDLTALMWAAGHEDGVGASAVERVVDLLLAHGAAINDADNRGRTALMIAASLGDAEVVGMLLDRGADRNLPDKVGKTALDLAANTAARARLAK
jgi:uncharacterized protein